MVKPLVVGSGLLPLLALALMLVGCTGSAGPTGAPESTPPEDVSALAEAGSAPDQAVHDVAADAGVLDTASDAVGHAPDSRSHIDTAATDLPEHGPDSLTDSTVETPDSADDSNAGQPHGQATDTGLPPWDWPCLQDGHCKSSDPCLAGKCVDGHCQHEPMVCPQYPGIGCEVACNPFFGCNTVDTPPGATCLPEGASACGPGKCFTAVHCSPPYWFCDDGNPCTEDPLCNPYSGCTNPPLPDGTPCDDGNPCTTEACDGGVCSATDNTCVCDLQDDQCEQLYGDGDLCNGVLLCAATPEGSQCVTKADSTVHCSSKENTKCATHACNQATGQCEMVPEPQGKACNDLDPCTENDACTAQGTCKGTQLTCEDNEPCTIDRCEAGVCLHEEMACDDGNPWTLDLCTPDGCDNSPVPDNPYSCTTDADCPSSPCCTSVCNLETHFCMPGGTPETCCCSEDAECDDGNPCTLDQCSTGKLGTIPASCCGGCEHVPIPECCTGDAACDDADPCTVDTCSAGTCSHIWDPSACLPPECLQADEAYQAAVVEGKACEGFADCQSVVPASLLCGCSTIVSNAALGGVEAKSAAFDALGCTEKLTCAPCQQKAPKAGLCIEGKCKLVDPGNCAEAEQALMFAGLALEEQGKGMSCSAHADCQQCFLLVPWMSFPYIHTSISLTAYNLLLEDWWTAGCCCDGDDWGAVPFGPCCIEGVCTDGPPGCSAKCTWGAPGG